LIRKHLTYANVTATLALAGVIGGGGAYAVSEIGSRDIKDDTVRSADLRDRRGVRGADVARNSLRGSEIAEHTLDAARFVPVSGAEPVGCNPTSAAFLDCAAVSLQLERAGRILAIATGGQESSGASASATCEVRINDVATAISASPGEASFDNTSGVATNGFARTVVSNRLPAGTHRVALACRELLGDTRINHPTVAAIGIADP
jgi:hypothetical protein